jgi:hypothetical protein
MTTTISPLPAALLLPVGSPPGTLQARSHERTRQAEGPNEDVRASGNVWRPLRGSAAGLRKTQDRMQPSSEGIQGNELKRRLRRFRRTEGNTQWPRPRNWP